MRKSIDELWELYERLAPVREENIGGRVFRYRYYKNPAPETEATFVTLAGGTGAGDGFFFFADEFEKLCSFVSFNYPMDFRTNSETADAVAELLSRLECKNIWLFGQSYGGLLAQIIAARHPELVRGMILSSTISLSNDLKYAGMERLVAMISEKKEAKNKRIDKLIPMKLMPKFIGLAVKKYSDDPKVQSDFKAIFEKIAPSMTGEYFAHMDGLLGDLRSHIGLYGPEAMAALEDRVLIFAQEDDKTWTPDMIEAMLRFYPKAEKAPSLEGGHLVMMSKPEEYFAILKDFIRRKN